MKENRISNKDFLTNDMLQRNVGDMVILINDTWTSNINMAKGCLISTNNKKSTY